MGRITTLEDRMIINNLAQAQNGFTDSKIVQQVGWSIFTVRKWRRLLSRQGRQRLASVMGRPATGALSSFPPSIKETLRNWRQAHPGWGPKTLKAELQADENFKGKGKALPSKMSIARFLKEEGLIRPYERHSNLPQATRKADAVKAPHEEWEMDAKGQQFVDKVGVITLINLNDCYSRTRLLSYPCFLGEKRVERHATTEDYQLVLRLAFSEWGLPDRIATDHDTVFYDNGSKSPFPSRLHLWLLALGVELVFGRFNRPTDQGLTERSHQLWEKQVLLGQEFDSWNAFYSALLKRRDFLNHNLPCASIGELPPLVAYPEAQRMRRLYRPEWEAELLDIFRIYAYLAKGRWFRLASNIGSVSVGGQVYVLGRPWAKEQVEITFAFDASEPQQHFVFRSADGEKVKGLPIKGITVETLTGIMGSLVNLPEFQLALPFTWDEWQVIRLYDTLGVRLNDT